ncbi:hypothetical protein SAMN05877838_0803 [Hoeflea halophila]|uniref:Uncharacterized protein n=1 Tax=Hoeflea halophila TaxID=714899 RepID=A0A286HUG5_9HYPH|nr:hypothetical protein [Hoeflea halophila]SOE10754.1 hypothetical protein SAMN05877838_0803 [Hoeflea halophila]
MIIGSNKAPVQTTAAVQRPAPDRATVEARPQIAATDALAKLDNFVQSAAQSRKALAEERLAHLQEQMNTLALFNMAPGFLAGHTARMAKELESAANGFVTAFKALAELEQPSSAQPASDNPLPTAYLDVLADQAPAPVAARLTPEDAETAASFMSTAHQLRSVVETIANEARDSASVRWVTDSARASTSRVSSLMSGLEGPSAFNKVFW